MHAFSEAEVGVQQKRKKAVVGHSIWSRMASTAGKGRGLFAETLRCTQCWRGPVLGPS